MKVLSLGRSNSPRTPPTNSARRDLGRIGVHDLLQTKVRFRLIELEQFHKQGLPFSKLVLMRWPYRR